MNASEYKNSVKELNRHTKLYDEGKPEISDKQWDDMYFEVEKFEEEHPELIVPESPTQSISFDLSTKVVHKYPMLSLAKTKNIDELKKFTENEECIIMPKMDGLTVALTFEDGSLVLAETRGNGIEGEDVTKNALTIKSIPQVEENIVVFGEVICKEDDFEKFSNDYKNPRNFASGSLRLQDSSECAKRNLTFVAWDCVDSNDSLSARLDHVKELGFTTVPYFFCENLEQQVDEMKNQSKTLHYPIDGCVVKIDSVADYDSKGVSSHHPKGALAFKFYDETYPSVLKDIVWQVGRTGVVTPVAVFDPVEIDGTIVERASLHNLAILKETLGTPRVGEKIEVYKANQIIPQIYSAEGGDEEISIPDTCPVCGEKLVRHGDKLYCENKSCGMSKKISSFAGDIIDGFSSKTIEKLMGIGVLNEISDLFLLKNHKDEWANLEGFTEEGVEKILNNIPEELPLWYLVAFYGIEGVSAITAKKITAPFSSYEEFRSSDMDFSTIPSIGESIANAVKNFDYSDMDKTASLIKVVVEKKESGDKLSGKSFCVTGKLNNHSRKEIENLIITNGGKVSSVNKNLSYLVCNDSNSTSSKMKKAKELGIKVITEEEFESMI